MRNTISWPPQGQWKSPVNQASFTFSALITLIWVKDLTWVKTLYNLIFYRVVPIYFYSFYTYNLFRNVEWNCLPTMQ